MESKNIEVIFSGHFHPYDPIIIHHKQGGVEYIGVGAYQMKGFGVVTIDNNRFVYHTIRLTESPQRFLMTNPIPIEQLSSHQIFSEKETEIRIISYVDHPIKLTISGDIKGEMKFDRNLTNGAKLYTFPLNVSYGVYNIHVTGDGCNIIRTFYVGEKYQGHDEPYECYQRGLFLTKVSSIFVFLGILWALLPINSFKSTETEEWIEGSGKPQWLSAIFFGPNSMRTRILGLPKSVRYTLLAALLYCLVGPNHFFKSIHGYIGFSFLCFIHIAGKTLYDEWAVHMTYFYLLTIIVPATFVASSYKYRNVSFVYKFNYILLFLLWAGVQVVNYRWCGESVPIFLLFVNPTFIVIPLIIQIVFHRANINFFFSEKL